MKKEGEFADKTIHGSFSRVVSDYPGKTALKYKDDKGEYKDITLKELDKLVNGIAGFLKDAGIKKGDRVAIFSYNRPEWLISDLAILKSGGIVVPIYHTFLSSAVEEILKDSGSKLIFVEDAKLFNVIEEIRGGLSLIEKVVVFDAKGISEQKDFLSFNELKGNKSFLKVSSCIFPDDAATIVYTSGTTGVPKGVVLTHYNIVSNAFSAIKRFKITSADVFLSFLPLCHMFERTCGCYAMLFAGVTIAYVKDISTIIEDVNKVHPTIILAVPRVMEKIYEAVEAKVMESSFIRRGLVMSAVRDLNKRANLRYQKSRVPIFLVIRSYFYDIFIASRFRRIAGKRLRLLVSGGAPLDRKLSKTFYVLGFNIVEGYGLTETSPVVCSGFVEDLHLGTVGKPFDDVEIKISLDNEILVKGPNLMKGYFNKPEETARVIDKGGWFHTGDQGKIDSNGNIIITGRIKEIIITSYGKNIFPVLIESAIETSNYIEQAMVYGDKRKYLTALIVPEKRSIENYAGEKGITANNYTELLNKEEIKNLIACEIKSGTVHFPSFEQVKAFTLLTEVFSIGNEMLTPTLKLRRNKIAEAYRDKIDLMYRG